MKCFSCHTVSFRDEVEAVTSEIDVERKTMVQLKDQNAKASRISQEKVILLPKRRRKHFLSQIALLEEEKAAVSREMTVAQRALEAEQRRVEATK